MASEQSEAIFYAVSCGFFFTVGKPISTQRAKKGGWDLCFIQILTLKCVDNQRDSNAGIDKRDSERKWHNYLNTVGVNKRHRTWSGIKPIFPQRCVRYRPVFGQRLLKLPTPYWNRELLTVKSRFRPALTKPACGLAGGFPNQQMLLQAKNCQRSTPREISIFTNC
jgi:hypothetical protein